MTLSPHGLLYESFGVFCPTENLDKLYLLREEDVLINWNRPLYMNFIHCDIAEELFRLYNDTGSIDTVLGDVWAYEKAENNLSDDQISLSADENVEVLPLTAEHAEGIHELYPANDMECHELFLRLIKIFPAAGVFVNGNLAAWMIQSYYGAMFSMQTKPEYRRKGYGTRLARYLTKVVADRGFIPFVVIRPENEASKSLYTKLGFKKLYQTVRATFTPHRYHSEEQEIIERDNDDALIMQENFANAVKQLKIEQRVIDVLQHPGQDDEPTVIPDGGDDDDGEDTILDPLNEDDNDNDVQDYLETIEEQDCVTEPQNSSEDGGGTTTTGDD
ncbi:uncharacterized protein [Chelonus insularis]|nr:uncharacterized protein LOC118064403 isoform X2 [Chelonus insularis]